MPTLDWLNRKSAVTAAARVPCRILPHYVKCVEFVNPDLIARGLSPFAPERAAGRAGRLVLERIRELATAPRGLRYGDHAFGPQRDHAGWAGFAASKIAIA